MTCSLLLPQGLVFADGVSSSSTVTVTEVSNQMKLSIAAGEVIAPSSVTPDPTKVKFTKEEAIAKIKSLFPILKDTTTTNITLGNNNVYPAPENQMIWDIQWSYQNGNTTHGFSTSVDAITGDLISAYISLPNDENVSYYPPKLSEEDALKEAKIFIAKAAPSIAVKDLQLEDNIYSTENRPLFGPVQYSFYFTTMKNGLPSQSEGINIAIDANGSIVQFSKPSDHYSYPSSTPTITQNEADKLFNAELDVSLYYIPIQKNGKITDWIMGYRPAEYSVNSIDAITGKRISYDNTNIPLAPITYSEVPQTKQSFKTRNMKDLLTAEEAAKLVKEVTMIPDDRTLIQSSLHPNYMNSELQSWSLNWGNNSSSYYGFSPRSSAEIDANTGEISQFQFDIFANADSTTDVTIPSGLTKLTKQSAKQTAINLINKLYPNANSELKLINHDDKWTNSGDLYRYEFQRFYKGTPVSEVATISFDKYGRLQSYYANRSTGLEKIKNTPVVKVTKAEALDIYRKQYNTVKLQYSRFGGVYSNSNVATKVEMRLVYIPTPIDRSIPNQVLDAASGKWVSQYEYSGLVASIITPTDLKGHSAEKALTTLVEYGILTPDSDGKLKPDEVISEGDWLTMMVKSITPYYQNYYSYAERKPVAGVQPDSSIYDVVSYAVERQWIKNDSTFQPANELTREQLAVLLSSIVNYSKLATYLSKDNLVSQFSDASVINDKGAVAIVIHLGLMEGENGKFNPQQKVTQAQAASILMKLVEIQGKTDSTIGQR